ncbi:putative sporulation protein YtxC [Clostridium sp. MB40-C1]|uniref:putative sporulation protein YtxC n=1 Tax=Clostridium sp. MB40-C1 TaxID=3070996 RepID=UPI0027DFA7F8|nr:putative sporulation protein YtxC [Clostridium sp. MB40-C1]WMJ81106.1 putative sporulation protein YtxC [Clostridium sp. MB40-C1]
MLLHTIVYKDNEDRIIDELNKVIEFFEAKDVSLGRAEYINNGIHFIKIFCDDSDFNEKLVNKFSFYLANILYKIVVEEYCCEEIQNFLNETYFFLKYDDMKEIANTSYRILNDEDRELDEDKIYCLNKKNDIIEKIQECIKENNEINIEGFITFRMKKLTEDLESIVNKVAEKHMVEKEYDEFIKLLKYFVEVQESKIEEVNIIIKENGEYIITDKKNKDIMKEMLTDIMDSKYTENVSTEDLIISGLITYSPKNIVIHHVDNCTNKEIIDTIRKVFEDRVKFCDECSKCAKIKSPLKV